MRSSDLIGMYHSGKGAMHRARSRRYSSYGGGSSSRRVYDPDTFELKYYYPDGTLKSVMKDKTIEEYHPNGKLKEIWKFGLYTKEWDEKGRIIYNRNDITHKSIKYRYDENDNIIYYEVNGKDCTVKYLAMQKVAKRQAEKSEKLRKKQEKYTDESGVERERQTVKKLTPIQKMVQMTKARREVRREMNRR